MNGLSANHERFLRELMRGDRSSFKRGYTPENAAIAVQEMHDLTDEARDLLIAHGEGFRDGIALALDPAAPIATVERTREQRVAYQRGLGHGRTERSPEQALIA